MQWLEEAIESRLGAHLGVTLAVAVAERRARAEALQEVLRRLGHDTDAATLAFPHPKVSLTYAGDLAVAVAVSRDDVCGVGVDAERVRPLHPDAARFFLACEERAWVLGQPAHVRERHLLRLWTVKEALFKATPDNRATILGDYAVADPGADAGWGGRAGAHDRSLRYATTSIDGLVVTVAVADKERRVP